MYKKAQIVLLPTDKAENSLILHNSVKLLQEYKANHYFTQEYLKSQSKSSHHLYVLSDDEIKENDWYFMV